MTPGRAGPTVAALMAETQAAGVTRLDAQLLIAHVLQQPRAWLLAHDDEPVGGDAASVIRGLVARRADGVPVAYLTGRREFHGLELAVTTDVLVPRPETELLVDWAISCIDERAAAAADRPVRVADLGCGSGAIALALKHARPSADVLATDVSDSALRVASGNAQRLGLAVRFAPAASWWLALDAKPLDVAASNPPYVAGNDPHLLQLSHEPTAALTPGGDGLGALREIVRGAPAHLNHGGWLLLEHGFDQGEAVRTLLTGAGFDKVSTRRDLAGLERCTGGCWLAELSAIRPHLSRDKAGQAS